MPVGSHDIRPPRYRQFTDRQSLLKLADLRVITESRMDLKLTGKPVIVCASSAGLGKATAMEFAREGAQVMICGRREGELQRAAADIKATVGEAPRYTVADVTRPSDIARLVGAAVSAIGGGFALVHNSGGASRPRESSNSTLCARARLASPSSRCGPKRARLSLSAATAHRRSTRRLPCSSDRRRTLTSPARPCWSMAEW